MEWSNEMLNGWYLIDKKRWTATISKDATIRKTREHRTFLSGSGWMDEWLTDDRGHVGDNKEERYKRVIPFHFITPHNWREREKTKQFH